MGDTVSVRKPNEGASKKFPEGKAFARNEGESEDYVAGGAGKKQRERIQKDKNKLDLSGIDPHKFLASPQEADRGGRGGRGRGRGGDRGERSDRGGDRGSVAVDADVEAIEDEVEIDPTFEADAVVAVADLLTSMSKTRPRSLAWAHKGQLNSSTQSYS